MPPSLFNFHFRLLPWELCLNLNFDSEHLAPGVGAVCTRDHLGLFVAADPANFDTLASAAEQLARALVQAHAYCSYPTGRVLDVEPTTWLEVRDCEPKATVTGYMHPSLRSIALMPGHPDNAPLLAAAGVVRDVGDNISLRLALADFHAARREPGLYYAFYAYRTLEDVGYIFGVKDDHPDWGAMNAAFGTTKATWDPLTEAGTKTPPQIPGHGRPRIEEPGQPPRPRPRCAHPRHRTHQRRSGHLVAGSEVVEDFTEPGRGAAVQLGMALGRARWPPGTGC